MTAHRPIAATHEATFPDSARTTFAAAYPDQPVALSHNLVGHSLLSLDALATLAERMPASSVEYNLGKLPLGVRPEDTPSNGLTLGETIRTIETNGSWAVLKMSSATRPMPPCSMRRWPIWSRSWRPGPGRCSTAKPSSS